jgi:pentatricopeptide repeat protein
MNKAVAQTLLKGYTRIGHIQTSKKCREKMDERGITMDDFFHVIMSGQVVEVKEGPRKQYSHCRMEGLDLDENVFAFEALIDQERNTILCTRVF